MQINEIINVKMKHLHKIPEDHRNDYAKVLRLLKPSEQLGRRKARNIYLMQYGEVESMRGSIHTPEGALMAVSMVFDCPEKYLMDYRLLQFYPALNHVAKVLSYLDTLEENNLSKKPKKDMLDAGIHRLNHFGNLNTTDRLGKEFGMCPEEIEKWSYNLVYHLMWKRKVESDIDDDYAEITRPKTKKP